MDASVRRDKLIELAKRLSRSGPPAFTSETQKLDFAEAAIDVLSEMATIHDALSPAEWENILRTIADASFDILGDQELSTMLRMMLIKASCSAIAFAASLGVYSGTLEMFWDLAIGAIPDGSPSADIRASVRTELEHLRNSSFASAVRSAEVGLQRLGI